MAYKGAITVNDECGQVGKVYTNPTIAVPPGGLSSLSFRNPHGPNPGDGFVTTTYDPGLPKSCQTYQYASLTESSLSYLGAFATEYATGPRVGANAPMLDIPAQLKGLDPAWKNRVSWITDGALHAYTCKSDLSIR